MSQKVSDILMALFVLTYVALLAFAFVLAVFMTFANAHDAPTGWQYDASCCSGIDCQQAPKADVTERPDGYHLASSGEVIPYSDPRIHRSKDEFYHECKPGGDLTQKHSFCLYVPDKGY